MRRNEDMSCTEAGFSSTEEAPSQSKLPATRQASLPPGWRCTWWLDYLPGQGNADVVSAALVQGVGLAPDG